MEKSVIKFDKIQDKFLELVDEKTFKKECSFALQAFAKNNYLASATTESKLQSVLNVAQTGLTLNPVSPMAYLVPRSIKGQVQCTLMPSYQGLVKLITDTGSVTSVSAYPVYEGDEFEPSLGTTPKISHTPKFKSKTVQLVYAVAVLPDGSKQIEIMGMDDIHAVREYSESWKAYKAGKVSSCVWVSHDGEMWRKSVLKRLCKYLPKSERWERLNEAIGIDDVDMDFPASYEQVNYALSLIETSTLDDDRKASLEKEAMGEISASEISKMISHLQTNQLDEVSEMGYLSKTNINNHVARVTS